MKLALAGVIGPVESAHNLTAANPAELTRIVPLSPGASAAGHPTARASPRLAPGRAKVRSAEQVNAGIGGKANVADAVR